MISPPTSTFVPHTVESLEEEGEYPANSNGLTEGDDKLGWEKEKGLSQGSSGGNSPVGGKYPPGLAQI